MTSGSIRRDALAIGLATGAYAVSYGVLAVAAGLSVAKTCAMSLLVFTGASQFAVVGVLGAGGGVAAALAPALLLAARNALYGLALVPVLRGRLGSRAAQSQLIIDESTAMARAQRDPVLAHRAFLATGVSVFVCWNVGTLAGALLGTGLGDPRGAGARRDVPGRLPRAPRPAADDACRAHRGDLRRAAGDRAGAVRAGRGARARGRARRHTRSPGHAPRGEDDGVSWIAILALGAIAYALKAIGPVLVGRRPVPADVTRGARPRSPSRSSRR